MSTNVDNYPNAFTWWAWQAETEMGNDDDRPGVYFLTIVDPDGEEYATIMHRVCDGRYPLDGEVARGKVSRAETIVAALNEHHRQREAVALHLPTD